MRKLAIFGSREGVHPQDVVLAVNQAYEAQGNFILVSGGGPQGSVNFVAETTALEIGLPVISFRPAKRRDYNDYPAYGVDEWRLHRGSGTVIAHDEPTWADWQSAAQFRSMLMAERAERGLAFHAKGSRGTEFELHLFEIAGKFVHVETR